ncbi:MAG TPA: MFS transporter, partial [Phenylobacterium sp.]
LQSWGWPALFLINLPLAGAALVATLALPVSPRTPHRLDLGSLTLNAVAFGALIAAAEAALRSPRAAFWLAALGVCALLLLLRREIPKSAPLLPLDLLRLRSVRLSASASVCCFAAQASGLLALPFLLQEELGLSPLAAGLHITAWPAAVAATALIAGRLADRVSTAWLCALGGAALSAGLAGLALRPLGDTPAAVLSFIALAGVGFGLFQTPNNRALFLAAPLDRSGAAGGLQGSARVTGQTVGALTTALLFSVTLGEGAPRLGLATGSVLAMAAAALALARRGSGETPAAPSFAQRCG